VEPICTELEVPSAPVSGGWRFGEAQRGSADGRGSDVEGFEVEISIEIVDPGPNMRIAKQVRDALVQSSRE
jgi:hypothetical protein